MGGLASKSATQQIPSDVQGMRGSNINLLNYILFGQQGQGGQTPGMTQQQVDQFKKWGFNTSNLAQQTNAQTFGTPGQPAGDASSRLQSVFGNLAPPGISQFLNQPSPEQQALNTAMPGLQEILSGGATPQFQQDLSLANQQGGRFGSANEILRGQALTGLFNQRTQAAQTLGMLAGGAGQGQARQAGMMDLETQRRLQLLMSLLGTSQGASFNNPFIQQPSALDTLGQIGGAVTGGLLNFGSGGGSVARGSGNSPSQPGETTP